MARAALSATCEPIAPLFDAFEEQGFQLFLVGGSVRDALLGKTSGFDYDFATDARPDATEKILRKLKLTVYTVGARFGTIAAVWPLPDKGGTTVIEITTFRHAETYSLDNRKPIVSYGDDIHGDLGRRDLSINAMAINRSAELVDPFNGEQALARGILEVPGGGLENTRSILSDDPLRILRIARFLARLGFEPTSDTTLAATEKASRLTSISHERWKSEIDKTVACLHVVPALRWMIETGAFEQLFDVLPATAADSQLAADLLRAIALTSIEHQTERWTLLVLAAHAASVHADSLQAGLETWQRRRKQTCNATAERFRLSRQEVTDLTLTSALPAQLEALGTPWSDAAIRHQWDETGLQTTAMLRTAAALAGDGELRQALLHNVVLTDAYAAEHDPEVRLPKGLGNDVSASLGISGRDLGLAMRRVHIAVLDGELINPPSVDECLAWLHATLGA
jgi:tRNA nucleotidyltransferase/poly(A) polymerase